MKACVLKKIFFWVSIITTIIFLNARANVVSSYYNELVNIKNQRFEHSQIIYDGLSDKSKSFNFYKTKLKRNSCLRIKNSNMRFLSFSNTSLKKDSIIVLDNVNCKYILWPNVDNVDPCCVIIFKNVTVGNETINNVYKGSGLIKKLTAETN